MMKRVLISVYDKDGIIDFARFLQGKGYEIISTGGTYKYLKDNEIEAIEVNELTDFPEMLDGRVKTLHPIIHAGILARRDDSAHMDTLKERNIGTIDMVIVNLYPFFEKYKEDLSFEEKVEFIDIGGPTMLRAAAKNFNDVVVVTDKNDYEALINEMLESNEVKYNTRKRLAGKVFNLMSSYDAAVAKFLMEDEDKYPEYLSVSYKKAMDLRYGENPHQKAAYYVSNMSQGAMNSLEVLNGKELSYNNLKDLDIAWKVACEFEEPACCALKHNTPCGVAVGEDVYDSYKKAYECDTVSIFGGIVALNRTVDKATAEEMANIFLEVVAAPEFDEEALDILKVKKNLRIIKCNARPKDKDSFVSIDGGVLVQQEDSVLTEDIKVVSLKKPSEKEFQDMIFGMKVVKYVKSNAIVLVKDKKAVGIGAGQVNRIWAANEALERGEGACVMASDAFFPFNDVVEAAGKHNITAIIQPGGSIRDEDSIKKCDELGISMVFTGVRHFKH